MRSQLALLVTLVLAAVMASNALATTPRDDAESNDTSPAEVGVATPSGASSGPTLRALAACSSGAHTLSHFGDRVYPGPGQRRLHERPHRRLPLLRRADEPVPAGHARRPDRPRDAVPHRLQPRLRAVERQPHGRAEHGRHLRDGERPARDLRVRAADVPGRPERAERPRPAGARDVERQPRQRDEPEPARLLAAGQRQRPERESVPREQARDHACRRRSRRATPSSCASTTPAGRASTSTATARPRAGSGSTRPRRRTTAASSRPSRWARRPGCRSTTTRPRSRPTTSTTRSTSARPRSAPASSSAL